MYVVYLRGGGGGGCFVCLLNDRVKKRGGQLNTAIKSDFQAKNNNNKSHFSINFKIKNFVLTITLACNKKRDNLN